MKHLEHALTRRLILAAAVAGVLAATTATAMVVSEPIQYRFLFGDDVGAEVYKANHDNQGIPKQMDLTPQPVSADLMQRIAQTLPESKDVRVTGASALIADSDSSTLNLTKDADIWMTFLHEGAGYQNAIGYYAYPAKSPPQSRDDVDYTVVWPNASYSTSGGNTRGLRTGQQVYLGRFTAGTKVGFFLIANGWDFTKGVIERYPGWVWHSLQSLNMETNPLLRAHIILLRDETNEQSVLGVEDINREKSNCDQDFNDVMVSIQANPFEAISKEKIAELVDPADPDKDGVMNSDDDYPQDPLRASRVTYPSSTGRAQLAFEDMWPIEGDYDLDDLVLAYTLTEVRDAAGLIRDLEGSIQIKSRGSAYSQGFGLNFPNLVPEDLASGSLWVDEAASRPLTAEPGQRSLTLLLIEDSKKLADRNPGSRTCYAAKFNAERNCPEVKGPTVHFQVTFKDALTRDALGAAPYNPFIYIVGDRPRETHLPDHLPTDKHKTWLFGWQNEGSDPKIGRYFKTKAGLPWAINLPDEWQQPLEKNPVNNCYPAFVNWVNTAGAKDADWYKSPVAGCVFPYPAPK